MASFQVWLEVLSYTKALFEAVTLGRDIQQAYQEHQQEADTRDEAHRASIKFSTFSEEEVQSLLNRLKGCRDRFVQQGGGTERAQCICSVLNEAMKANGGVLPVVDDWRNIYKQLKCSKH